MTRLSTADDAGIDSRRVERIYSVLSRVYDTAFDWALGPGRRVAVARLPIRPGEQVLEVGVGTGLSLPHYPASCHVSGIDISQSMLDQARRRAATLEMDDVRFRRMDAHQLEFGDASFDHVLAPYVISVVPDPERVMAEIGRVCRPGGTVVVVNHFHGEGRLLRFVERVLTPATQWIGFRLDQDRSVVTAAPNLEVIDSERVNLFGLWSLLILRR